MWLLGRRLFGSRWSSPGARRGGSAVAAVRVLVAENCQPLADLVAEVLSSQGIAADVAYNAPEAASKLVVNRYDVAVLDSGLLGGLGGTLCCMVAQSSTRVMTIMLGGGSPAERLSGLALGADDYMAKPFHLPELVLRVRALARRRPCALPVVLRAGGLELDSLAHSVRRDGRPVDLSAKELGVLEALLAAAPGYVSAEELLESVWDENADPFTKTVTVTVGRLRRKLGAPPLIETAVGLGYRIFRPSHSPGNGTSGTGAADDPVGSDDLELGVGDLELLGGRR